MRLRNRYLLAGIAWALVLAPAATYLVLGAVAGALWLFVYGDAPWPAALDWVIPGIGVSVFLSVAAFCIHVALVHGRRKEAEADDDPARDRRSLALWTLTPLALIALTAGALWLRSTDRSRVVAETERREAVFMDRLNARHTIAELVVRRTTGGDVEAGVTVSDGEPGAYRLLWQVRETTYGEVIAEQERNFELAGKQDALSVRIPFDQLARGYRDTILSGGGVVVDEAVDLVVALEPAIDEAETRDWPAFERDRWEQGETPLRSGMTTQFRLRFLVHQDGTIERPPQ